MSALLVALIGFSLGSVSTVAGLYVLARVVKNTVGTERDR